MSNLGLSGLVSGVSTDNIIEKILRIETSRISAEANKKKVLESKQNAWQKVRSSLEGLRSKLDGVRMAGTFRQREIRLSDDSIASVTASAGAALTTHTLTVRRLAQSHVVASGLQASPNVALNITGTVKINTKDIALAANDTLNSLRDKINNTSGVGVTADVVKVVQGGTTSYRLVLTSKTTGLAGAISVSSGSGLTTSDATKVDPAGSTASGAWDVLVSQLATKKEVRSAYQPSAQTFAGTFELNGVSFDGTGKTLAQIRDDINTAMAGVIDASTENDGGGNTRLILKSATTGAAADFTMTDTSTILQDIGMVNGGGAPLDLVSSAQDATYTINGGAVQTSATNNVSNAGGVVGLNLTLKATTGGIPVRIDGLEQDLGFRLSNGSYNKLSDAQDSDFTLDGVDYQTSSNVVSDVMPNLTVTLKKGSPAGLTTTVTVDKNTDAIADSVQKWVDSLNSTMSLLADLTKYDDKAKASGILNGDALARQLQSSLRRTVSSVVTGLPSNLNQLSQVGVTTGTWGSADYGKIVLDKAKLKEQILADEDGVARVFGALRKNVALSANGASIDAGETSATAAGNYAASDVLNGDADSERFGSAGGGWESAAVPSTGTPQKLTVSFGGLKSIDQVKLYLPDSSTIKASETGLRNFTLDYFGADGAWHTIETVKDQVGPSRVFEFEAVQASKLRLSVTATYGAGNPARVTELEVNEVSSGAALTMYSHVRSTLLSVTGPLDTRDASMKAQVDAIDKQITNMTDRLAKREELLRRQFARMEDALSRINRQGGMIVAQMGALNQK